MTDEIKMEYPLMEEMSKTFNQGAEQLQDTLSEMQNIASMLEDGALLGQAGAAFTDSIRSKLSPALGRLVEKFQEMQQDVVYAMQQMKEAEETQAGMFN